MGGVSKLLMNTCLGYSKLLKIDPSSLLFPFRLPTKQYGGYGRGGVS